MQPVLLYGSDHSPWVQTVLIALEYYQVPYEIVHYPISWYSFRQHGLVFPACLWPDGTLSTDSLAIVTQLERRQINAVTKISNTTGITGLEVEKPYSEDEYIELKRSQKKLERFFLSYVLTRAIFGKKLSFIKVWAQTSDQTSSRLSYLISNLMRSFITLYFFSLINIAIISCYLKRSPVYSIKHFCNDLSDWNQQLYTQDFLGGLEPNYLDYALLGHIQCITSGLTKQFIPFIHEQPHLILWIHRMHALLPKYQRLYSRRLFNSHARVRKASRVSQFLFYSSLVVQLALFPITLIALFYSLCLRYKNPARTAGS